MDLNELMKCVHVSIQFILTNCMWGYVPVDLNFIRNSNEVISLGISFARISSNDWYISNAKSLCYIAYYYCAIDLRQSF